VVSDGHGVMLEVNAGVLWNDPNYYDHGAANHAISVIGVARDPDTGDVLGMYINDSGTGDSGRFVDVATLKSAWEQAGGEAVVVESSYL
jgi:hypothetical protein